MGRSMNIYLTKDDTPEDYKKMSNIMCHQGNAN